MKIILLVLAFFLMFLITFDLFLKEPPVWPDEASLAYMSSLSSGDLINDYRHYPSTYTALLSAWFKITNTSIEAQRILSVFAGLIFIIIFCFLVSNISKIFLKNDFLSVVPIILLITDFTFLQATRVGRPEIFTLFFGIISIYLLFLFIFKGNNRLPLLGFSFIFAILAFIFHVNGIIYLLTVLVTVILLSKKLLKNNRKIIPFFVIFLIILFIFISFLINLSLGGILLRFNIANAQNTWLFTVFTTKPLELKLIYLSFIIITLLFFVYVAYKRKFDLFIIAFPLALSWVILIFNKDFWYAVYLIPLVYLSAFILLKNYSQNRFMFFGLIFLCSILFLSNLKFHIDILSQEGGDRYSYQQFITEIQQVIPDGKSVFTSAIPDPYYAFVNRKNNKLTRFPQGFVEKGGFLKELNETDFIIYNGPYGSNYYGNTVMDYLKINVLKIYQIGSQQQYQAIIAELKPRNQRINP